MLFGVMTAVALFVALCITLIIIRMLRVSKYRSIHGQKKSDKAVTAEAREWNSLAGPSAKAGQIDHSLDLQCYFYRILYHKIRCGESGHPHRFWVFKVCVGQPPFWLPVSPQRRFIHTVFIHQNCASESSNCGIFGFWSETLLTPLLERILCDNNPSTSLISRIRTKLRPNLRGKTFHSISDNCCRGRTWGSAEERKESHRAKIQKNHRPNVK